MSKQTLHFRNSHGAFCYLDVYNQNLAAVMRMYEIKSGWLRKEPNSPIWLRVVRTNKLPQLHEIARERVPQEILLKELLME